MIFRGKALLGAVGSLWAWGALAAAPAAATTHPINIGHRGGYALAPENTIPTFLSAIANGIDVIETDIWLSEDGVPVIMHDLRLERTTDGTGLVTQHTLAELKQLDVGIYFGPEWAGTQMPTAAEAYVAVVPNARFLIDIKQSYYVDTVVQEILDLGIPQSHIEGWMRHGIDVAAYFHSLLPGSKAILLDHSDDEGLRAAHEDCCEGIVTVYYWTSKEYVDLVHSYGLSIYIASVPDDRIAEAIAMEGDGVMVGAPHLLAAQLAGRPEPECSDGVDNDGDGLTDHSEDPSCWGDLDNDESNECSDGIDNDGDGATDFPADGSCYGPFSVREVTGCSDGIDNNSDGLTDHPDDPGCIARFDWMETPECWDGIDNDGDGLTDHFEDTGCAGISGAREQRDCDDGIDNDLDGKTDYPEDPYCVSLEDESERPGCWDGFDNDGDGWTDYPLDPECRDLFDLLEAPECSDGLDNDGNGLVDHPADPTCASPQDDNETGDILHLPASGVAARLLAMVLLVAGPVLLGRRLGVAGGRGAR